MFDRDIALHPSEGSPWHGLSSSVRCGSSALSSGASAGARELSLEVSDAIDIEILFFDHRIVELRAARTGRIAQRAKRRRPRSRGADPAWLAGRASSSPTPKAAGTKA